MGPFGYDPDYMRDTFGFFEDAEEARHTPSNDAASGAHFAALAVFELRLPIDEKTVKTRYKELVKKHHPDANGGTKEAEEKFKEIRLAYETLKSFLDE